jgi:AAA domain
MAEIQRSLTALVYGESKVGKSTFAVTAPYPRLMLDVEGGHRFLPIVTKYWDPMREEPPKADGSWDTCVVLVNEYSTVQKVYQWLQSGQHHFASLIIDSISELQVKCIDQIAGDEQMKMQQWGELLRSMGGLLRNLRDLTMHPTNPLEAVVLTAMAVQDKDGRYHPYLQGQLKTQAPYFYDILGALTVEQVMNPDPMQMPFNVRRMYVERTNQYEAGERVQGRLGAVVEQQNLSFERMMDMVFGEKQPAVATAAAVSTKKEA